MMRAFPGTVVVLTLGFVLSAASASLAQGPEERVAVATTPHFAFHSDLTTNLNDALTEAGRARNDGRPELFQTGAEASCIAELPRSARTAWDLAVDYYTEVISSAKWSDRQQYLIRVDLAGVEELEDTRARRFVGIARSFIGAATPAYEACRWPTQNSENRRWIEQLVSQLGIHEDALSAKLGELYEKPLAGLPMRVDVVETVNWSGATTILLFPVGGHILIANEAEYGPVSLELVFHEASHTLMGRGHPVRNALGEAAEKLNAPLPGDLWHAVLFYTTGDTVRRILAEAGEPTYTPMLFAEDIFGLFHEPMESAWPAYLNDERTLSEAAVDLLLALDDVDGDRP